MGSGFLKKIVFLLLFSGLALVSFKINFSQLVGNSAQYFTFFQFFGPIAGAFLGPVAGIYSVLVAQLADFAILGRQVDAISLLRVLPMLFASLYFALFLKKGSLKDAGIIVPIACIALFVLNPVGMQAWYYSLFWTIPVIAKIFSKNLFLRSLGATFSAHAVGGAIWVWTVPMTAEQWTLLIPITAAERVLFALGISVSFILFNNLLNFVETRAKTGILHPEKKYLFRAMLGLQ